MPRKLTSRMACGAAAAVMAASGCSAGEEPEASEDRPEQPDYLATADPDAPAGGALDLQVHVDTAAPTGLDPQMAETATSWQLMGLVYETLVTVGPDFEIEPALAEEWDNPDPTTYVFHLREDVDFSNGRPMTAADVVASMERLLDSASVWRAQIGPIESVEEVDEHTVEFSLSQPYTPFLAALANVPASILPMEEIEDGELDPEAEMLGTGPFTVAEHRQDVSWEFEANEDYWAEDEPAMDAVNVEIVTQEAARIASLQDGSTDMAVLGNVDSPAVLEGASEVEVVTQATTDFYYLMLNSLGPDSVFADQRVREAVNIAIDRRQIAEAATGGQGQPTGVTPVDLPGSCDPEALPSAEADTDRVEQLLAEAGVEDLEFNLAIYSTEPAPEIAQIIEQSLAEVGITAHIDQMDEGSWVTEVYGEAPGQFDAALSWFAGYADAGMVPQWWNPEVAGFNAGFMEPVPEITELIDTAGAEEDGEERDAALEDLCAAVDTDAQMIPLVSRPMIIGYRSDALSPTLYGTEGYGNALRHVSQFREVS